MSSIRRVCPLLRRGLALALLAGTASCEEAEQIVDRYRDLTPHEAYAASLEDAGLAGTALGREWLDAAREAADAPAAVALPYLEEGFLPPEDPAAVGLRFTLRRGQVVTISAELVSGDPARLFVDFFRVPADSADALRPVASADTVDGALVYEPWRTGDYVLRLQPELLRGGRYRVRMTLDASLAFPVDGRNEGAIQSFFGAERDGGRRDHHGVDIFAPRNTPVLAATEGTVARVRETSRGGRVVWLRDARRRQSLYYAHLERQLVEDGQRVVRGDTLGLVGNSGNARTTPPHLHFGIYRRGQGPVDPLPFVRRPRGRLPEPPSRPERLGQWLRAADGEIRLRALPSASAEEVGRLERHAPFRVVAGSGSWYRVALPDGTRGWVAARLTESTDSPVVERTAQAPDTVRALPGPGAAPVEPVQPGTALPVMGRYAGYLWVVAPGGRRGWISDG